MSRVVTIRFRDDGILPEIDEASEVIGVSLSQFVRDAVRDHLDAVKENPDFPDFLINLKKRTQYKLDVIDRLLLNP